jgi:PAS domain-containing protein
MQLENEAHDLERIAKAFWLISKEISYGGLANALLGVAIENSGAARGTVLLSEGGELLAKANASFPPEKAQIIATHPPHSEFRLPADCSESFDVREPFVRHDRRRGSALLAQTARSAEGDITVLCLPLIQDQTIGVLYLEAERDRETFTAGCVSMMSLLASQAAVSFESAQLFEALRETTMWMVKGQQIGRMGSFRWNTCTLLSRGSRECDRILGLDPDVNPVPFQAFRDRVLPDDLRALEHALAEAVSTQSPFSHPYRVVYEDGATFHVIAVGQFDVGPSGDVELEGIITDITEQKAAEQALTDARAKRAASVRRALHDEG